MPVEPVEALPICRLDDVPDGEARGFTIGDGATERAYFIVRRGERAFVYENSCPHTGVTLDWQPDVFMDVEKRFIQCATHGALFRIEDGFCVHGPCVGAYLTARPVRIDQGLVYLTA